MNNTRLLCLGLLLALMGAGNLFGQQLSLFTQYREAATLINPAALESDFLTYGYNMSVGANYRRQWAGQENTPETQSIRFSYINPYQSGATITAGGYLLNDQTGPTGYTGFYGRIGTVLSPDPEQGGISVGLSAGYVGYRVRSSELILRDVGDPLGGVDQSQSHPDIGLGVYAYRLTGDHMFYGGVSIPQLLGFDLTFQNDAGDFEIQRLRHYYGMAGWYWFTGADSYLEVSTWVKYVDGAPFNADVNLRYQLPSAPYIGFGMSTAGNFHFEAGINVGQSYNADTNFRVGYGFDYSFQSFGPSVGGTHEIQLAVALSR
ncbi:PorP/SprF family type IX secretion system membrane protein [Neolewinella agarilytica]|uniref:Type IX secretion system membrane protein, PorP/SprF family n=1 Tax=Neolewinella agarilytica TaxID=478744 RepID=A0A1H8YVX0_9BACT|nr:PorP/SprF family type IX secretion system membrane protein [Neolewinella agarilytica]SEP56374.1 type IX secretion system membrane protein, PorP/SprF family [Neolewinella agarilytica]